MDDATRQALERDLRDRLVRYARVSTQADHRSDSFPSSAGQWDLLRLLHDELVALGCADVAIDAHGYVMATVPSTLPADTVAPTVAFFAHVDTAEDVPAADVTPVVWERYDGRDLALPGDPAVVLSPRTSPSLRQVIGHDLITSDGRTLLGADDKAGVAATMAAADYLLRHPEIAHGPIRLCFSPDEEIGRGMDHIDLAALGADVAYTMDAGDPGEVQDETFSADGMTVRFKGVAIHPGYAKHKLVNAIKVAADFVASLPRAGLSPETTDRTDGYVHPLTIEGNAEEVAIRFIVRDFETARLAEKEELVRRLAAEAVSRYPGAQASVAVVEQYRNMRDMLAGHPTVAALADEAVRRVGLTPVHTPVRGGTDGSRLCAMGLPTPNLFTGGHNFHSRAEWASVQQMGQSARTIIELVQLWAAAGQDAG